MSLIEKQYPTIKRAALIILCLIVVAYLSYLFAEILAMLVLSVLVSLIFNPVVDFIEKRGFKRSIAVLFVFLMCGALVFSGVSFLIPKILNQMNALSSSITPESLKSFIGQIEKSLKSVLPFLSSINIVERLTNFFQSIVFGWTNDLSNVLSSIVSVIAILIIVPFMTFFLLKDNARIVHGIINVMPNKYFEVSYWVIKKISIQLGRFVRGWILDALIVGLMAGVGLTILGINNAVSIGFVAGVGHLIPYFGPVIGGIPAILISLIQFGDFSMFPRIFLLFAIIYLVDNGFIQPNIFSKSTDMHPLVIILLILIGSQLLGVFGMLLAVPTATVIKTAAKEIYYGYKNYKVIRA